MEKKISRIGLMFHESFKLNRSPMSEIVDLASKLKDSNNQTLTSKYIKENTFLGNNYIKAFPPYCKGAGLLNFKGGTLTYFGKLIIKFDPLLSKAKTLWLMHYHLSSLLGPGPEFWSELVISFFKPGTNFSKDDIREKIATLYWEVNGKTLAEKSINSTTTAFINSYIDSEGLGKLGLISSITEESYLVNQPNFHYPKILAYALWHFWEQVYTGSNAVSLDRLIHSDLPKLFLLPKEDFKLLLNELKAFGLLDIHRTAQPFQVFLKYEGDFALDQIYGTE